MESIRALREKLQSPRLAPGLWSPWWIERVCRIFSIHLTRVLVRTRVTANGVTILMFLTGMAGALCFLPGRWAPALCGALLLQMSMILDCCDGEVARYRGTSSLTGNYLDALSHYVVPAATLFCASFGLSRTEGEPWLALGGAAALFLVWTDACYDLRFKAAYLGHRSRILMGREMPDAGEAAGGTPAGTGPPPRNSKAGGASFLSSVRGGVKFVFEPTVLFNVLGVGVIVSKVGSLAWGEVAAALPLKCIILFYAVAGAPYVLLSTALVVRYGETELHGAALRRLFSK
ncbi:MAG: CDP-alcohol phosphatidyltransferase family protein [bacterium]|nr:CDP-alcohol phosphatidyltransferase family protein [bacterium]